MKHVPDFPISVHVDDNPLRKKDSRFLCNVRFRNELPEIPSDPKMLLSQLDLDEIGRFKLFKSEKETGSSSVRFPLDMGLPMSALYVEQYDIYEGDVLDGGDAGLLEEGGDVGVDGGRKRGRGKAVGSAPWLMRTKYISSESGIGGGSGGGKKRMDDGEGVGVGVGVQEQIRGIKRSFQDAQQQRPVHPLNKTLTPVDIKPILPDEALQDWKLVLVNFDSDPVEGMKSKDWSLAKSRKWAQSLHLKTLRSAEYGRFAVILAPRDDKDGKVKESNYGEDDFIPGEAFLGDYEWMRTYNETVRVDENGQTYLFRVEDGNVEYSDLSNKLFLRKRKKSKKSGGHGDVDGVESLKPEKMVLVAEDQEHED